MVKTSVPCTGSNERAAEQREARRKSLLEERGVSRVSTTVAVVATEEVRYDDVQRLMKAGYAPVVRWRRVSSDGRLVLATAEALSETMIQERRAARRKLRSV